MPKGFWHVWLRLLPRLHTLQLQLWRTRVSSWPLPGAAVTCHPREQSEEIDAGRRQQLLQQLRAELTRKCSTDSLTFSLPLLQLVQSNFVLFCTYAADLRDHFQNIVLTILVSGAFSSQVPKSFPASYLFTDEHCLKGVHPFISGLSVSSNTSHPSTITC